MLRERLKAKWKEWEAQSLPGEKPHEILLSLLIGVGIVAFFFICVLGMCGVFEGRVKADGIGAATFNAATPDNQNYIFTVTSNANATITLQSADYTLVHLNISSTSQAASSSTDYVVIMNQRNAAGNAVTMVNDLTSGGNGKFVVQAGASATFNADLVPQGSDGPHEIQLRSVGHDSVMQLIRGHFTPP